MTQRSMLVMTILHVNRRLANLTPDHQGGEVQHEALAYIAAHPGGTVKELSQACAISESSGTQVVERLARRGLIARRHRNDDRRQVSLSATSAGVTSNKKIVKLQSACWRRVFQGINDRQLKTIIRLQKRILANLEQFHLT